MTNFSGISTHPLPAITAPIISPTTATAAANATATVSATATAAAATLAAAVSLVFNPTNLSADVYLRFEHHLDSDRIMTQATMVPFAPTAHNNTPTLFYLDPPPGGSNRIIAINGQFFPLDSQGTDSLKALLGSVPTCHGTTPQDVCTWY